MRASVGVHAFCLVGEAFEQVLHDVQHNHGPRNDLVFRLAAGRHGDGAWTPQDRPLSVPCTSALPPEPFSSSVMRTVAASLPLSTGMVPMIVFSPPTHACRCAAAKHAPGRSPAQVSREAALAGSTSSTPSRLTTSWHSSGESLAINVARLCNHDRTNVWVHLLFARGEHHHFVAIVETSLLLSSSSFMIAVRNWICRLASNVCSAYGKRRCGRRNAPHKFLPSECSLCLAQPCSARRHQSGPPSPQRTHITSQKDPENSATPS